MTRAITTGIIGGMLLVLASLYPVLGLVLPALAPGFTAPISNPLFHGLLLMVSAVVGLPLLVAVGAVASFRTFAQGASAGARTGLLAGLAAGTVYYGALVMPVNAIVAITRLFNSHAPGGSMMPANAAIVAYVETVAGNALPLLFMSLLAVGAVSLLTGLTMAVRQQRRIPPARPTLAQLVDQGQSPRRYFNDDDRHIVRGMQIGLGVGLVYAMATLRNAAIGFQDTLPEVTTVIQETLGGQFLVGSFRFLNPLLAPLSILGIVVFGGLVVAAVKDPPSRLWARVVAVIAGANALYIPWLLTQLYIIFINMGIAPYALLEITLPADALMFNISPDALKMAAQITIQQPVLSSALYFMLPWFLFVLFSVVWSVFGAVQGLLYGAFVPLVRRYPVDIAATLTSKLRERPNDLLPIVYNLFRVDANAYSALVHISANLHRSQPDASRTLAYLHTLSTTHDASEQATLASKIAAVVSQHPEWRWSADFSGIYRAMEGVLNARSVAQILDLPEPAEQQTTSLPPVIVKSVDLIRTVVSELAKSERMPDMNTRLIFLENALEAAHTAEQFLNTEFGTASSGYLARLPEHLPLTAAVKHWQGLIIDAIQRLKGRAEVTLELKNRTCPLTAQVMLMTVLRNVGLNVAEDVRVTVQPGEGYDLISEGEAVVDILPPGSEREVSFVVAPHEGARRIRLAWEVKYDDAVDEERSVQFGDVVEFTTPDKPFQRIFPIPYVTGTPLKTDDVFVGREEVFTFIRENLVGAHQNNVIILHGQRRTGKTSVLYRLAQVMAETHYGVLLDMQGKPARGEVDFLYSIADDIVFALEDNGIEVELPPRSEFEEAPEFYFRSRFLRSLRPHLNGKHLLLMFDEFEELQRRVDDGLLKPDIFQFLRNLMQHEDMVDFVFSGTHKLEQLGAEYWSVLFNIAVYKPITFLSKGEVRRLMTAPVAQYSLEYDPLSIERVNSVTAGHPYFTQLVLHELVAYHNESERSYMTVMDVDQALNRIVERGEAHFKYIWSEANTEERQVLRALTERLINAEEVSVTELREFLTHHGYTSPDHWSQALAVLESRDIITRRSARNPLYRFKVDLVRRWIERTQPPL